MKRKRLTTQTLIGQEGINLIERIVLRMGSIWNPTVAIDVGIDGNIELCEPETRHPLGIVLLVQSRATEGSFQAETDASLEYLCSERELAYWMQGNAPVLLIVSRPKTEEAYWVSIKSYFADPTRRASRRVRFDKDRDRFTQESFTQLRAAGASPDSGIYLGPPAKTETLVSNLLEVAAYAPRIYVATTNIRKPDEIWAYASARGVHIQRPFILKEGRMISFHDLREKPWSDLCDPGSVDDFDSAEWATAQEVDRKNEFVWLLRDSLREKLYPAVVYRKDEDCFAFRPHPDMKPFSVEYQSQRGPSTRQVFTLRVNPGTGKASWYRHDAFEGFFRRYDGTWYLEINPTYVFTVDGDRVSLYQGEYLSKIKRVERNPDVRRHVLMWASYLGRGEDLISPAYPFLAFGDLLSVEMNRGIDDAAWVTTDEDDGDTAAGDQAEMEW